MMDQYYTPPELASLLAAASRVRRPTLIADFAVGDGALLRAASLRWPSAVLLGTDIDPRVATFGGDSWKFIELDFLSTSPDGPLNPYLGRCDLILLNPPFTCRGNARFDACLDGTVLRGSKALAFVARALPYLKRSGELLAIVPASCLTSHRDEQLLTALRASYGVSQVGGVSGSAFKGCSVQVVLLRFKRLKLRAPVSGSAAARPVAVKPYEARLMRGVIPVYKTSKEGGRIPVIHTSDLTGPQLCARRWTDAERRIVDGPAILMPRVGRPDYKKVALHDVRRALLSDCVIAIRTQPRGREDELLRLIRSNWDTLSECYGGSCAPYISLRRLTTFLRSLGVISQTVSSLETGAAAAQIAI